MNRATWVGRVGKEPEIKSTQTGKEVANFTLATSERWKDPSGQKQERTSWHNIVCWHPGLIGVIKNYVHKGDQLLVEGSIETRSWEKDGEKRYTTEIVMNFNATLEMLGSPSGNSGQRAGSGAVNDPARQEPHGGGGAGFSDDLSDEIPFRPVFI